MQKLKGIIFDLDGTLVDSKLDFQRMKQEMGLPLNCHILEEMAKLADNAEKTKMWEIIDRHEQLGLENCTLFLGVKSFLNFLSQQQIQMAILTRNSKAVTIKSLEKFKLNFFPVLAREDVYLPKPHPEGLFNICRAWEVKTSEVIFIGDYLHDLLAGQNAGIKTLLFKRRTDSESFMQYAHAAFECFTHLEKNFQSFLDKLGFCEINVKYKTPLITGST